MAFTSSPQPTLIAIASHKGGSGRTTLALNLAAAWSAAGHKTVVVDLDPRQGAALWAMHTNQSTPNFNPLTMVLAGLTENDEEGASPVADILRQAKASKATRIVVDLPAQPDYRSLAALRAASLILIPSSGTALDTDLTAATLRNIREATPDFSVTPIVVVPMLASGQVPSTSLRALGLPLSPIIHRQVELSQGLAEAGSKAETEITALADYTAQHMGALASVREFATA